MKVRELKELVDRLAMEHGEREVACVCALCDCETFVSANPKVFNRDAAADAGHGPGNCDRVLFLPE